MLTDGSADILTGECISEAAEAEADADAEAAPLVPFVERGVIAVEADMIAESSSGVGTVRVRCDANCAECDESFSEPQQANVRAKNRNSTPASESMQSFFEFESLAH